MAVQSPTGKWFLVNVSPDVRYQLEEHGLAPAPIEAALITNADLDHSLGLLLLREGQPLRVVCRPPVRSALEIGLGLGRVIGRYCGVEWLEAGFEDEPLLDREGRETGLGFRAVRANGGPPRYSEATKSRAGDDSVGFRIQDQHSGRSVLVVPDVDRWTGAIEDACDESDLVLFDGTFWTDDELASVRPGARTATQMGHLPISGPKGSLVLFRGCKSPTKVYVHINNTNPILLEGSAERAEVEASGVIVGDDGMSWDL